MSRSIFLALIVFLVSSGSSSGEIPADKAVSVNQVKEILWIDGKLPASSETEGNWLWDEDMKQGEALSHTDGVKGFIRSHSFKTDKGVGINRDSRIIQYVFLDPKNSPSGIMMKFLLDKTEQISVYWEGDKEVFADMNEYITAWYMGPLPEAKEWQGLEIDFKELDITEAQLEGICFIATGGRLWWGKTVIIK